MNNKDKRHAEARWKQLGLFEVLNYSSAEDFIWKYLGLFVEVQKWKEGRKMNKTKSLKANLYKTSVMVFENELRDKQDIEKVDFFIVVLQRMSINYNNLGAILLNLIRVNIKKISEIWFFNLSSLVSQYNRGIYFEEYKPVILDGLLQSPKENLVSPKTSTSSNSSSIINQKKRYMTYYTLNISYLSNFNHPQNFEFDLTNSGLLRSEIYCEDGMIFISPYYQSIYDADIFLELSKKYPYSILLFFQNTDLYLKILDSIYKQIRPNKVCKGRITIYENLEPGTSKEISIKTIVNIDGFNEFIVKSISLSEKNLVIKYISGVFKSKQFKLNFDKIYSGEDLEIPKLKLFDLTILFNSDPNSKVFLNILSKPVVNDQTSMITNLGDKIDNSDLKNESNLNNVKFESNISISLPLTTESNPILLNESNSIVMEDSYGCLLKILIKSK